MVLYEDNYFSYSYSHDLFILFVLCTAIYTVCKKIYYRKIYSNTVVRKHVELESTTKLFNFKIRNVLLANNNAIYLTNIKCTGVRAYVLHFFNAIFVYFTKDIGNFFTLLLSIAQVYDYKNYPYVINVWSFALLMVLFQLYTVSDLLKQQNKINDLLVLKYDLKGNRLCRKIIKQADLVRGDIVKLTDADDIPADVLLLNSNKSVSVREYELSGEDIDIPKTGVISFISIIPNNNDSIKIHINHFASDGYVILDSIVYPYTSKNILYRGTKIVDHGHDVDGVLGVIIETGNDCNIYRCGNQYNGVRTRLQKLMINIYMDNFYLMILLCSLFGEIIYIQSTDSMKLWTIIRRLIILLNTLLPIGLPITFMFASSKISGRLEKLFDITINKNGNHINQVNPHFIVSDKTGTLTTNELTLHGIYEDGKQSISQLLYSALACTDLTVHSSSNELLKSDIVEATLVSYLLKLNNCTLLRNTIDNKGIGEIHLKQDNKIEIIKRHYYKPFDYKLGVKIGVIEINGLLELHIQGIPENVNEYSCNALSELLININSQKTPDNVYKRVIAHAYRQITMDELNQVVKPNINFSPRLYVFYDYVVPGIKESIKQVLDSEKHFTMLTGDKASSAVEIGNTIGIINEECKSYVIDTMNDLDTLFSNIQNVKYCYVINGKLLDIILSTHQVSKLIAVINSSNSCIIFRATPNDKQAFVEFLQREMNNEVVMIGDGSNDVGALMKANIGVCIKNGNNSNVQKISHVLTDTWNKIPQLLNIIPNTTVVMNNVLALSIMRYMQSAFFLITMLVMSGFKKVRDPAGTIISQSLSTSVFLIMYVYVNYTSFDKPKRLNVYWMLIEGAIFGIVNAYFVFSLLPFDSGMSVLICIQLIQLIMKLCRTVTTRFDKKNKELIMYCIIGILWFVVIGCVINVNIMTYVSIMVITMVFGYISYI